MVGINPVQVFLWTFRKSEGDVIKLYNYLSPLMELATDYKMLNFGYWKDTEANPQSAQNHLCGLIGKIADLKGPKKILDVGSGFSAPAIYWNSLYNEIKITCINTNFHQLLIATKLSNTKTKSRDGNFSIVQNNEIKFLNATSTCMPVTNNSVDTIIALESAQHFKPFDQFIRESKRVLRKDGSLVIAIPIVKTQIKPSLFLKLGILSFTWSSEHYNFDDIKSLICREFLIDNIDLIGDYVYSPLADYYSKNRKFIKEKILKQYPAYVEKILYKSLLKMKKVSQKGIIDYAIIKCSHKSEYVK